MGRVRKARAARPRGAPALDTKEGHALARVRPRACRLRKCDRLKPHAPADMPELSMWLPLDGCLAAWGCRRVCGQRRRRRGGLRNQKGTLAVAWLS